MAIRVDRTKCQGIGLCEMTAPEVFRIGDDGYSHVINTSPGAADLAAAEEAVRNCPTGALSIDD
ncbi:ferredoxin [Mycobacterium sp. 1274756.6]|uniref:ferredoxin n=1 Tax=Mycobacterium sp. 1274756.6 TaxID=1834076 RepID=UPI0009EE8B1D|nr:ferredoxin [Mycobacterium sp. 1274756.6]